MTIDIAHPASHKVDSELAIAAVQPRTLCLLFATQIISGGGFAIGASVGALLDEWGREAAQGLDSRAPYLPYR